MANKRHKPEEIVTKLRQVEVLVGQGMARIDAIRKVCIVEQTYYRWRCPSSKHLGRLSLFRSRGSGSPRFDVKPLVADGSSGVSGWSVS